MSRWTTTREEFASVIEFATGFPMFGEVAVRLKDGTAYSGLIVEKSVGNDSGHSAQATLELVARRLRGSVRLSLIDGEEVEFNALDIETYRKTHDVELISARPFAGNTMTMYRVVLSFAEPKAPEPQAFVVWTGSDTDARRATMAHVAQAFPGTPVSPEIVKFRDNAYIGEAMATPGKLIPYSPT